MLVVSIRNFKVEYIPVIRDSVNSVLTVLAQKKKQSKFARTPVS